MKKIIWVYNVVLSHGLLLHALFPSLIKLMNTARHVREWHKKNKELIYSSREPPSPKTKATISPLPGLGWITVCQNRNTSVYMRSSCIYNIPPLL